MQGWAGTIGVRCKFNVSSVYPTRGMTRLTIAALGGLSIQLDAADARSELPTRKSKAILAYLALSPGMLRSREHLKSCFSEVLFDPIK